MAKKKNASSGAYPRLETLKLSELKAHPDGVRTHSPVCEHLLAESVKELTLLRLPVLNARTGNVIDGDLLLGALRTLGREEVPVWVVDIAEEHEDTAHLALNNHAGEWQWQPVSELLRAMQARGEDLRLTGFHDYDYGPLVAADWKPAQVGPLDGSDPNQPKLL